MIAGIAGSGGHYLAYRAGLLHYATDMAPNFYGAICGWTASMVVTISLSLMTAPPTKESLEGLVYRRAAIKREPQPLVPPGGVPGRFDPGCCFDVEFSFLVAAMEYVIGLDIGSSSAKVGLFTLDGESVAISRRCYPTHEPFPGYKEQDPETWWAAVCDGLREVTRGIGGDEVVALGATGHISSFTFVDRAGAPLRPAVGFQDQRALAELEELYACFSREELAAHLGIDLPPAATWPLPKLLWFKKHEPEMMEAAHHVLQAKDFINLRLTGEFASDASSNRGIVDLSNGGVAEAVLSRFGLRHDLLPRLYDPEQVIGVVRRDAAKETGLRPDLPVVAGWNDLNASVLGCGAVSEGDAFNITGTSEHIGVVTAADHNVPELMCAPFLPGRKLLYGVTSCGGGSLELVRRTFRPRD